MDQPVSKISSRKARSLPLTVRPTPCKSVIRFPSDNAAERDLVARPQRPFSTYITYFSSYTSKYNIFGYGAAKVAVGGGGVGGVGAGVEAAERCQKFPPCLFIIYTRYIYILFCRYGLLWHSRIFASFRCTPRGGKYRGTNILRYGTSWLDRSDGSSLRTNAESSIYLEGTYLVPYRRPRTAEEGDLPVFLARAPRTGPSGGNVS